MEYALFDLCQKWYVIKKECDQNGMWLKPNVTKTEYD